MAVLSSESVLCEEALAIHGGQVAECCGEGFSDASGRDLNRALNALDQAALCLSGGGIRSASFALGVMQALASHPRPLKQNGEVKTDSVVDKAENCLLARFHYLSTVSGGGYIGSWLTTWLARRWFDGKRDWTEVWTALIDQRDDPVVQPAQVSWLRRYSNYLTPKLGVNSADSWAAIALVLRNLVLNWLVLLPLLCALLIVLKLLAILVAWCGHLDPWRQVDDGLAYGFTAAGAAALVAGLAFTTRHRPTSRYDVDAGQTAVIRGDLLPALGAALMFVLAAALPATQGLLSVCLAATLSAAAFYAATMMAFAVLYAVGWAIARPNKQYPEERVGDFGAWCAAGLVHGAMVALGLNLYWTVAGTGFWLLTPGEIVLVIVGLPWGLASQLTAEMVFVGLTSGQTDSDSDREWLGRAAGIALVVGLGWVLVMFLVFLGSRFMHEFIHSYWPWLTGGGSGGVVAWLGKSSLSPAKGPAKTNAGRSANVVLAIAGPLFVAVLIVLVSALLDKIILDQPLLDDALFGQGGVGGRSAWQGAIAFLLALGIVIAVAVVASKCVNINRFSLHALYRNRLIRAFLGASNDLRTPDLFTGFDEADNIRMYGLWPEETRPDGNPLVDRANWRPFHVVNMALNCVSAVNLAWQERKAMPFTATALHAGCSFLGYRYISTYGDPQGISVGTAMAISGAAASPNQGYNSSPSLAILMTLLNVRLGWWLGNPGSPGDEDEAYKREGPARAAVPLLYEMIGRTTAAWRYVYLSDGGHFDNLGLYEMVRRRCRFIVISDAGCDPKLEFEDLGNAVRKISIDLNVPIRFHGLSRLRNRAADGATYGPAEPPFHAVGTIDYAAADGTGSKPGTILYLKPCFLGNRIGNVGVRNYASLHTEFPHESTVDQFFSESQFESYRALGFEMMDSVLCQALSHPGAKLPASPTMADYFGLLPQTVGTEP